MSEKLDSELREKAAGLGVSVSNLVRNILLNTVEMVEDIVADGSSIARAASKSKAPAEAGDTQGVIFGWQSLTLNINAICEACNAVLAKGSGAAMAVGGPGLPPTFRCEPCVPNPKVSEEQS